MELGNVNSQRPIPRNAPRAKMTAPSYGDKNYESLSQYTSDGRPVGSSGGSRSLTPDQINMRRIAQAANNELMNSRTMSSALGGVSGLYLGKVSTKTTASAQLAKPKVPTIEPSADPRRMTKGRAPPAAKKVAVVQDEVGEFFDDEEEPKPKATVRSVVRSAPAKKAPAKKAAVPRKAPVKVVEVAPPEEEEQEEEPAEQEEDAQSRMSSSTNVSEGDFQVLVEKFDKLHKLCSMLLKNHNVMKNEVQKLFERVTSTETLWKHKLNEVNEAHHEMQAMSGSYQAQFAELNAKIGDKDLMSVVDDLKFATEEARESARWFWAVTVARTPIFTTLPSKGNTSKASLKKIVSKTVDKGTVFLCCQPVELIPGIGSFYRCRVVHPVHGSNEDFYVPFKLGASYFTENPERKPNPKTGTVSCLSYFDIVYPEYDTVAEADEYLSDWEAPPEEKEEEDESQHDEEDEPNEGEEEELEEPEVKEVPLDEETNE